MGCSLGGAKRACVGVANQSAEEAMEYFFAHELDPGFQDPFPDDSDDDENDAGTGAPNHSGNGGSGGGASGGGAGAGSKTALRVRRTPLELQRLFAQLQLSAVRSVGTERLTTKAFAFKAGDASVQHDAQVATAKTTRLRALARETRANEEGCIFCRALCPTVVHGCRAKNEIVTPRPTHPSCARCISGCYSRGISASLCLYPFWPRGMVCWFALFATSAGTNCEAAGHFGDGHAEGL